MSILTHPVSLSPSSPFLLVAAVALGVFDFFQHYAGKKTSIKWPNDIFWDDRKAGGILIENQVRNQKWRIAIIGIGININQADFGSFSEKAVSLSGITGKKFDIIILAKTLCTFLEKRYRQLLSGNSNDILKDYTAAMYKLNEEVRFRMKGAAFRAQVEGVSPEGCLLTSHPVHNRLSWGSVEWLI